MITKSFLTLAACTVLAASGAYAGTAYVDSKSAPAPVETASGGLYIGIFGGATFPDDSDSHSDSIHGISVDLDSNNDTGWHAGLKLGYIIPTTSPIAFAVEVEGFYNTFDAGFEGDIGGYDINGDGEVHSGAGLANLIVRGEVTDWLTLYAGAGAGYYYAEIDDIEVDFLGHTFSAGEGDADGFAWQVLGGLEIPVSETLSVFGEYKYLNYENADNLLEEMHLVSGGLRIRF